MSRMSDAAPRDQILEPFPSSWVRGRKAPEEAPEPSQIEFGLRA